MFDSIRKRQRLFLGLILILILPAFVLFGVQGYQHFLSDGDSVASVDGEKISRQEFDAAQRRQLDNLRRMFGEQFDPALLDTTGARAEVLDGLISQRVLLNKAIADHLTVSDDTLREAILAIPGLRKPDGSFDQNNYRLLLTGQGLSEQGFEAQMRRDLAIQSLPQSVSDTDFMPKTIVDRLAIQRGQTLEVRELAFKTDQYLAQAKPTDEQLKKFYDENARLYETPETLKVQFVTLDPLSLAAQVPLDDAKARDYYEQNKGRFSVPEQRQASHILVMVSKDADQATRDKARAKAEDLLKQLRGGADFATLAKAQSQDEGTASKGGDLGLFTPEMMVKPVSDATFALKQPGDLSEVVPTEFGYHIIKLTKIEPGSVKSFESVKPQIEADYRRQQAVDLFNKDTEAFTNMVYEQPDSLQPVADRFKLKLETLDNVARTGVEGGAPNAPLANPKVLAALFTDDVLKNKHNTQAIQISPQALLSARVLERHEAQRKTFDEVKADVLKRVTQQQARQLAVDAGQARLKAIQDGGKADDFGPVVTLKRGAEQPGIPANAIDAVFKASAGKLPTVTGVDLGAGGYGIYQVVKSIPPDDAAVAAQRQGLQQQMTQADAQAQLTDFIAALKNQAKIKRNLAALSADANHEQ